MHVALLWLMPEQPYTRIIEMPLKPAPVKSSEDLPVTPEDPAERESNQDPVKPLKGKPAPPELPDVPTKLSDGQLTIPFDTRPRKFDHSSNSIPDTIGTKDGVLGGMDLSGITIYPPDALDRVPGARVQVPPDYPPAKQQSGAGGSVLVEFDVDPAGRVVRAEAIRYTDREFAEPAVRAVRKWRFEPGRRNGKAVSFRMAVPIEFGITNN
jgi:protein TonB